MPEPKTLEQDKEQIGISNEDLERLVNAAMETANIKDSDPEKKEEAKKEEEEQKTPEQLEQEKKEAEEKDKEAAKKEEERLLNAKDEELSEEDKPKKAELVKKQEEAKTKAFNDEVEAYAKESNISIDEAKSDLESIGKLREKYKDDPKQLAKANLYMQRLYTKTAEELKNNQEAKARVPAMELSIENVINAIEQGKITVGGKETPKEKLIEAYRRENPDITEPLDDNAVVKLLAKDVKVALEKQQEQLRGEMTVKAKEKRETLLSSVSESDKEFLPIITPILNKTPDTHIMDEKFTLQDMLLWAKGKQYDALKKEMETKIKEAEERGFKKGNEQAKIIAVKASPKDGNAPPENKNKTILTDEQKKRALEMYDNPAFVTDQEKYDAYAEFLERQNKRK